MSQINASKQTVNTIIIVVGFGLLLYDFIAKPEAVYFKILGLVVLMFGLYKSTQQWTSDNKSDDADDAEEDKNSKTDAN